MTPCSPQSWSRRRVLVALLPPCAAAVAALSASVPVALVGWLLLAWVGLDGLAFLVARPLRAAAFDVQVRVRAIGSEGPARTGGRVRVTYRLRSARSLHGELLTPFAPAAGAPVSEGASAQRGRFVQGEGLEAEFEFTALQPGRVVFPGLLVRCPSPMRLFDRTLALPVRGVIDVLPDVNASLDPRLLRFLRSDRQPGGAGQVVAAATGSDFAGLRPYRWPDTLSQVDWKASARRAGLISREYGSPPEFELCVLLDVSPDMAFQPGAGAGWAAAAGLVASLSRVVGHAGVPLRLLAYDRCVERDLLARTPGAHRQLLVELAELPRRVLVDNAVSCARGDELARLAAQVHDRALGRFRGFDRRGPIELPEVLGRVVPSDRELAEFVADLSPQALVEFQDRCPGCGEQCFADEVACRACATELGVAGQSRRAAVLAELLTRVLSRGRRQTIVLVSSLQAGEWEEPICRLLELVATRQKVHVVVPRLLWLEGWRPTHPASLPDTDLVTPILRDVERLVAVNRAGAFRERMLDAHVPVHRLDARESLDDLIATILLDELLGS